jgi:hypothetical protein
LVGTTNYSIRYTYGCIIEIIAFSNSDWGGCESTRKSKSGYVVKVAGGPVTWATKSQATVALSSCEAELYALCEAVKEIMWLSQLLTELQISFSMPILRVDNKGAISLASKPSGHARSKHIEIRYFFVRDAVEAGKLGIYYISTVNNESDCLTKAVVPEILRRQVNFLLFCLPVQDIFAAIALLFHQGGALE